MLKGRRLAFCVEYLKDLNGAAAYVRAGYKAKSPHVAAVCAEQLLTKPDIHEFLAPRVQAQVARVARQDYSAHGVVKKIFQIANADPRELVHLRIVCCRYCYGVDNRYQFTAGELERHREEFDKLLAKIPEKSWPALHAQGRLPQFDPQGGPGYNPNKEPNADCPECFGEGTTRTVIKDMRDLSPEAVALYAGIKPGQYGIEIKMNDRVAALDKAARLHNLFGDMLPPDPNAPTPQRIAGRVVPVYPEREES